MSSDKNKRIAKNTLYLYIRLIFVLIVSLYTSRVVLQALGVVDYGIYNVVAGFVSMFALLNTALSGSVQRFYNYEIGKNGEKGIRKVFISANHIQFLIACLVLLLAETVGLWYVTTKMVYPSDRTFAVVVVYQASVMSLLFVLMQIPYSAAIIAHEKINYYAIIGVIDVLLKLAIALIIPLLSVDKLCIYGVLIAGVSVVNFCCYFIYARCHFKQLRYEHKFYRTTFVSMMKFSSWTALNTFSQVVKNQGINIVMNFFFGPAVNAARGISYQVKGALLGFVTNITTASQPQVTESYAVGNVERSKRLMFTISKLIFFSLYVFALPIMCEVNYVLNIWLGNNIPEYTGIFTILVLVITLVDILSTPISMIINASGKVGRFNFWYSVIGLSVVPIACFFLMMGANPVSVYVISLTLSIVMQIISMVILRKEIGIDLGHYSKSVLLPLLGVVATTIFIPIVLVHVLPMCPLRLFFVSFVSIILVAVSSYFIGLNTEERVFVLSYLKRFVRKITKKENKY